jgi:hypothetical protein
MRSFHTEDLEFEGSSYIGIILLAVFYGQLVLLFYDHADMLNEYVFTRQGSTLASIAFQSMLF